MQWHEICQRKARRDAEIAASRLFTDGSISPGVALLLALGEEHAELVARAVPSIPHDVLQGVESFLRSGTLEETQNVDAVWVCVTDALAAIVATGLPSAERLAAEGKRLERAPSWVLARWDERCTEEIIALDGPDREAWLKACEAPPARGQEPSKEVAAVSVTAHRAVWKLENPFLLWDEDVVAASLLAEHAPIRILWHADRVRWFRAIDCWQDARLVQGALFGQRLRDDPSTVVDLLRSASSCFDEHGAATGCSAAIVLCAMAIECIEKDLRAEADAPTTCSGGTALLEAFVDAVLKRSDGVRLGAALLTWLFDCVVFHRGSRGATATAGEARRLVLEKLSMSLSIHRIPIRQYRAFAAERRVLGASRVSRWQRELPALLACSRTLEGASQDDRDAHRAWLCELLLVSGEWSHKQVSTLIRELVAGFLCGADPAATCKTLFEDLEPQRRCAEFGFLRELDAGHDAVLPSLVLLASLVSLVENDHASDPAYYLVYARDRALRIALTEASSHARDIRAWDVIVRAIAVAIMKFGAADMKTIALVSPVAHDVRVLGPVLVYLSEVVDPGARDQLLMALERTLADTWRMAVEWAHVTDKPEDAALAKALEKLSESAL